MNAQMPGQSSAVAVRITTTRRVVQRFTPRLGSYTLGGMRRLLALIAILLGTTALLAGCSSSGGSVQDVSPDQFMTTAAEAGTVVVDVRTSR